MRKSALPCAASLLVALLLLLAVPAWAHVTVQPTEAPAGSFSRFVVRVPNERDDASTAKVEVQFPDGVTNASFQPKSGWNRTVTMRTLDEPIEVFGEPVTEVIDVVIWEGGRIAPGEFDEFGFTVRTPDQPTELVFRAVQTYDSGEEVRWVGEADSGSPGAKVTVTAADDAGDGGHGASSEEATDTATGDDEAHGAGPVGGANAPALALGAIGTLLGAVALAVVLRRR